MERFAREDVRRVLRGHGIDRCRRATTTDPTEEVFLLPRDTLAAVDVDGLTKALMSVLPDTKVWVVEGMPPWLSEPV